MSNVDEDGGDEDGGDDDYTKKSERKRQRERQRRFDLAKAFDELAALLSQVDPEDGEPNRRRRRKSGIDESQSAEIDIGDTSSGLTRLDMIVRTIDVVRRIHRENADLKAAAADQRRNTRDDNRVSVVVLRTPSR
jgi:hypothetical protein